MADGGGAPKVNLEFDLVTTRTGDGGRSSLYSGETVWKDEGVFEVLGDIDEVSSWLGMAKQAGDRADLEAVQGRLQVLMASVAATPGSEAAARLTPLGPADVEALEAWERRLFASGVKIEARFVLPGDREASARADLARTVCRRAERHLVGFVRAQGRTDLVPGARYLNRLSDVLFVLARTREARP